MFDLFGTYVRTIPLTGITTFQVREGVIHFLQAGRAQAYDMRSFAIVDIPLPIDMHDALLDLRLERGMAYLRTKDRILIVPAIAPR